MNTNINTRKTATEWWILQTDEYKEMQFYEFIKTHYTPSKTFASLTGREIEIIYSNPKLSENAIKGNAAMNTNITKGNWMLNKAKLIIYAKVQHNGYENEPPVCSIHSGMGIPEEEAKVNAQAIASLPDIMRENEELKKLASSFYMDICRAYNAGKENAFAMVAEMRKMGEASGEFKSSHDYFVSEFPTFKTNVP